MRRKRDRFLCVSACQVLLNAAMDTGMADYLSRMESTVLAARSAMVKLNEENSSLRARIKGTVGILFIHKDLRH